MDVTFTEEQQALRAAVADLLGDHADPRAVFESETGSDLDLYGRLIELGAGDLPGLIELGVVLEECGKALAPAPVVPVLGIALPALAALEGDEAGELLAATRTGDARPVLALDAGGEDGLFVRVPDAHVATHVLFDDSGTLAAADARACDIDVQPTMDMTRRLSTVRVKNADRVGLGDAEPALASAHRRGAVAVAHELVGVGQAALDLAIEYAKTREQFGRPIGVFQAISHRCAEMFVSVESARSHCYYAAWAVEVAGEGGEDVTADEADLAASQAKASASEAAVACAQGCIQVHGGIGFTWEHDAHLYLKRARSGAALLGGAMRHRRRIADLIGL
jgi:alkylation response protein AidB-like acyl-CoA dehydrogenase